MGSCSKRINLKIIVNLSGININTLEITVNQKGVRLRCLTEIGMDNERKILRS